MDRREEDFLGALDLPDTACHGIPTTVAQCDEFRSPEAVCRPGFVAPREGR